MSTSALSPHLQAATKRSATGTSHVPSLDGIRGIAAMIVFLSHVGLGYIIPGGFGVTVFFFLSGYLITTLLRREYETSATISLKRFYLRRLLRIFPPMYLTLALLIGLALVGVIPNNMAYGAVALQFVQLTNYYLIWAGSGEFVHIVPYTIPTWSLAVEEHFYLLFPFALLWLLRRCTRQRIAAVFVSACAVVLLWRCIMVFGTGVGSQYAYYATDMRLDSLLFGCILGIWSNPHLDESRLSVKTWLILLLLSVALLLFCFLYRSDGFRDTLRYTLQGVALFPLFYCAIRYSGWPIFAWLEHPVMRWLGWISYTFYLSQLACIKLAEQYVGGNALLSVIVGLLTSLGFATLVYLLLERQLATLRHKLHR
jgi:peptidoglycan/LPS O-acetylase OafA/YrhL